MRTEKRLATIQGMAFVGMLILSACGGNSSTSGGGNQAATPASTVSVTLVGAPADINIGDTLPVTAQVVGGTSTAVIWTVDDIQNGNSDVGTITGTGNTVAYKAPVTEGSHVVAATSVSDSSKRAHGLVGIHASTISSVVVGPAAWTLNVNTQNQFTATVSGTGTYSSSVTWSAQRGTVTSNGLYMAPATGGSDVVTATSVQDTSKLATASVAVTVPSSSSSISSVALSPTTLALNVNTQNQFTETVTGTGTYNSAVTWSAQRGSVTSAGLYTAPSTGGTDVVTAKSVQDTSKTATATVTVTVPPVPSSISSVALSPATLTLNANAQNAFTATVTGTGTYNSAVTWSAQRGSVTSAGLYTAPSTSGTDVVTAKSVQDTSKTATASITVVTNPVPTGINVKSAPYNAKGDGSADDTSAIQSAVNAVGSGGTVVIPAGTFMVNVSRDNDAGIILKSNMTLYLAAGAVLKGITSSAIQGDIVRVRGLSNVTINGPGTLQGDRSTHTGPPSEMFMCISINTSDHITVSGVTCRDSWSDGIYVSDGCTNITVSNVICDNNRRQGMSITAVVGMLVENSTFSNTHGTDPQCGIDVEPNAGQTCSGVRVTGCKFFGNVGGGFQQGASDADYTYTFATGTILENSEFYGNGGAGYHDGGIAFSDCNSNIIRNNNIHNNLDGGIKVFQHATNVTVTGNTVTNNTGWGITMSVCNGSVVTGNTVTGNSGTGFRVDSSTGTYTPNTISGNGP